MQGFSPNAGPLARHSLSAAELKALLAAERRGEAFLAYRDGDGAMRFFAFDEPARAAVTVGRRGEADLALRWDGEISALHAEMHSAGGEVTIVDDGLSTNGTYVNGERVAGRRRLRDGDQIRVGQTTLAYRAAQATLVDRTAAASEPAAAVHLTEMQRKVLIALCRPYRDGTYATPATNRQIAAEVFLGVDAVKLHLRTMFAKFGLGELPQNQKRAALAERALHAGTITQRELEG